MSTRATITVRDEYSEAHLYRHSDGYPDTKHGVLATLPDAFRFAWDLPRFEADEFAASICAAWKDGGGGVSIIPDPTRYGGIEYHYTVYMDGGKLLVDVRDEHENKTTTHTLWPQEGAS